MTDDPNRAAASDDDSHDRMQRVRVGLTGLAVVLLIIALATTLYRHVGDQVATSGNANATAAPSKDEPLADLGVAPGAAIDKKAAKRKAQ